MKHRAIYTVLISLQGDGDQPTPQMIAAAVTERLSQGLPGLPTVKQLNVETFTGDISHMNRVSVHELGRLSPWRNATYRLD